MRRFSSYGHIDADQHYYAARTELIERGYTQVVGENPQKGGHYITVWAPRQAGKSTVMLEVTQKIKATETFDVALITMEGAKYETDAATVLRILLRDLRYRLQIDFPAQPSWEQFPELFTRAYLTRPLILLLDEFDALDEAIIHKFASEFRTMYLTRTGEPEKPSAEKQYLLHGLALIGVRSVLGIENVTGSPFNVQRSLHIPNLTFDEVNGMFHWYQRDSGQSIAPAVIQRLYAETNGQPGLVCWMGELLTEGYEEHHNDVTQPITMREFDRMYQYAQFALPSNNLINIISKAKQPLYKDYVLELFETREKLAFDYNDPKINFLYMHGVIDREVDENGKFSIKFACPYIQKGLFSYFSRELFHELGRLIDPFDPMDDAMTDDALILPNIFTRYQRYLEKNGAWLFKNAPRRVDLRIREAVYHFNLYLYLHQLLHRQSTQVWPEFPTGNGKLDILITYKGCLYGIEVKSFSMLADYKDALAQAAQYGHQLGMTEIIVVFFIESLTDDDRTRYEVAVLDQATGVNVVPVFIETGA